MRLSEHVKFWAMMIAIGVPLSWLMVKAYAEDAVADAPKSPPVSQITVEEQRDYQRVRADLAVAQGAFDRTVNAMLKKCGDRGLVTDVKGDPECGKPTK